MVSVDGRIKAFASLGKRIDEMLSGTNASTAGAFAEVSQLAENKNPWFIQPFIRSATASLASMLDEDSLERWVQSYPFLQEQRMPKVAAVIMAGNIPAVGFHDLLCVLMSGNKILAKLSSKDDVLLPFLAQQLCDVEPGFSQYIRFERGTIKDFDAVIATGNDNSARYFDYYFRKYPTVIRKSRCSVAVLDGNESTADLENLTNDVFTYFGLGCRNVSKVFVPEKYDTTKLLATFDNYELLSRHFKYMNNYEYNKSIYLLNRVPHLDNGFVLLKEDSGFFSPISVVFLEKYTDISITRELLSQNLDKMQCIVSDINVFDKRSTAFGATQTPCVCDYADEIDTMNFLETI